MNNKDTQQHYQTDKMGRFLRGLGKFISEFARFILFFKSIFFLSTSLLLLAFLYQCQKNFGHIHLTSADSGLIILKVLGIYLVCLATYGVLASFFAKKNSIKWFALLSSLNVILGIAVLMYTTPQLAETSDSMVNKLKDFQTKYDWDHAINSNSQVKNATEAWDNLQMDQECCGIHSPKDWANFRPDGHKQEEIYPSSCCANSNPTNKTNGYCRNDMKLWTSGCVEQMDIISTSIICLVTFVASFSMVIALLAGIVLLCNPQPYYEDYS